MKYFITLFSFTLACSPLSLPQEDQEDDVGTSSSSSLEETVDLPTQEIPPEEKPPRADDCLCSGGIYAIDGKGEIIGQVVDVNFDTVDLLKDNYLFSVNLITGHLVQAIHPEITSTYQKLGIIWEESDCFTGPIFQSQMANGPCEEQGPPSVYQVVGKSNAVNYEGDYWLSTDLLKQSDEAYLFQSGWRMVNGECTFFSHEVCVRSLELSAGIPHYFELPISIN